MVSSAQHDEGLGGTHKKQDKNFFPRHRGAGGCVRKRQVNGGSFISYNQPQIDTNTLSLAGHDMLLCCYVTNLVGE